MAPPPRGGSAGNPNSFGCNTVARRATYQSRKKAGADLSMGLAGRYPLVLPPSHLPPLPLEAGVVGVCVRAHLGALPPGNACSKDPHGGVLLGRRDEAFGSGMTFSPTEAGCGKSPWLLDLGSAETRDMGLLQRELPG